MDELGSVNGIVNHELEGISVTTYRIGVTSDLLTADGNPFYHDLGLELLDDHSGVTWEVMEPVDELTPEHTDAYDGIWLLAPRVTRASFGPKPRVSVIARFGVGFDNVDVEACSDAGVALTITPDAVRRPVASAMLAMVLALAHRIRERDIQVREGLWEKKFGIVGTGLTGRTIGLVGLGRIGAEFCRLLAPFDVKIVAFDPHTNPSLARELDVSLLTLDEVLERCDFLCIAAPLTEDTHKLVDAEAFSKMKSSAYLINAARGPIVDEQALIHALTQNVIAGAALDVFDPEPPTSDNRLLRLDNVLLTPHTIAHTDELYRACGRAAIKSLLMAADGVAPEHTVNRAVLDNDLFLSKLNQL